MRDKLAWDTLAGLAIGFAAGAALTVILYFALRI